VLARAALAAFVAVGTFLGFLTEEGAPFVLVEGIVEEVQPLMVGFLRGEGCWGLDGIIIIPPPLIRASVASRFASSSFLASASVGVEAKLEKKG